MWYGLSDILDKFPKRYQNSHKGSFGKILNIAGSKIYSGAAILSSLSALKTGTGYVTLACPDSIIQSVASFTPDLTFFPLISSENGSIASINTNSVLEKIKDYDVISLGSGLTTDSEVAIFVREILVSMDKTVIIDADALNIISVKKIDTVPQKTVMTPHPKELSRLIDVSVDEIQRNREKYAAQAAKKFNAIIVLKGHETVVSDGVNFYINNSGNSALAKAGSGDVLTGIISSIVAQSNEQNNDDYLFYSAAIGVYLHGLAADIAAEELTEYSLLASDQLKYISRAINKILCNN